MITKRKATGQYREDEMDLADARFRLQQMKDLKDCETRVLLGLEIKALKEKLVKDGIFEDVTELIWYHSKMGLVAKYGYHKEEDDAMWARDRGLVGSLWKRSIDKKYWRNDGKR